jgi:ComF family protein
MKQKPKKLLYSLYHWSWLSLDWLFPPQCGGCEKRGKIWCDECNQNIRLIKPPICKFCGQQIQKGEICFNCEISKPHYNRMRSLAIYDGPLRNAILKLKYYRDISLGNILAELLIKLFLNQTWEVDIILPVPLGLERQAQRGYNQASLLAKPIALACGIAYEPGGLEKIKNTPSQVGLNFAQRHLNVKDVFFANEKIIRGKRVMLVDDVCTSGATITACAEALEAANAKKIYALTLARASIELT